MNLFKSAAGDHHRVLRGRTIFPIAFLACFLVMAAWSLASPLFSGPDEPVHVMKAAAMVRGQLLGELNPGAAVPGATPDGAVTLPKFYAVDRKVPSCFHEEPTIPASCDDTLTLNGAVKYHGPSSAAAISAPVSPPPGIRCPYTITPPCPDYVAVIYNARYPPLYYAIVGLPSLLGNANWAVYLMRLMSAALSSFFIALAITAAMLWSRHRLVIAGVLIAATPMACYLGGIVNPSGLETSTGIAVATTGIILVRERLDDPPAALIGALALSASVLELVRGLSPLWLVCTGLVLLGLSNRRGLAKLSRARSARIGALFVAVFGVVGLTWIFREHALNVQGARVPVNQTTLVILEHSFQHNDYYIPGMIGVFGSFDTYAPLFTYIAYYALIGFVLLGALVLCKRSASAVLVLLGIAILVLPVAISSSQVHRFGYTWAGRDTLPLAVALPIVAAALLGETALFRHARRLVSVVVIVAGLAQFAAFFEALRRYAVGTQGPDFAFLSHASWHPPIGVVGALVFEAVVLIVAGTCAVRAVRDAPEIPARS